MHKFLVNVVRYFFRLLGMGVYRIKNGAEPLRAYVTSDYKKFEKDISFLAVWEKAKKNTLVDILRCYELWSLVGQTKKLDPGDYLEVGVWRGGSGLIIVKAIEHFDIDQTTYLADTFEGVVKASVEDNIYRGGEHADTSIQVVNELLVEQKASNFKILKGTFPDETGHLVDGLLRLVHIDVDVYKSAKDITDWCYDRLVPGGVIVFDDYGFTYCQGVTKFCEEHEMDERFLFVHNVNGHCMLIKR